MNIISNLLWSISTVLLLGTGIYFAIKLNFLHLNFKEIIKSLKNKDKESGGISPFESLSVALGGCIGVGSLAGIALAIYKGGIGTIFWIWLSCLLVAPNSLVENIKLELNKQILFNAKLDKLMVDLVNIVGLERIKQLTQEFNEAYIEQLNSTKSKMRF